MGNVTRSKKWTQEECDLLKENYPTLAPHELYKLFPQRSPGAIDTRASLLGLRKAPNLWGFDQAIISKLTETQKAYLAGFFDGEGCIHIGTYPPGIYSASTISPFHQLSVTLGNTNRTILEHICTLLSAGNIQSSKGKNSKTRMYYQWRIYGTKAMEFLELLKPYFILKKEEAVLAIEFQSGKRNPPGGHKPLSPEIIQKRTELAERLKLLKGRIRD